MPGVLSDRANAFGCFLGALSGEECELLPAGKRWTNAGCVFGPQRAIAWRVLDAQYFGVAQRRKRVFLVASARDDFDPAEVLFESDGLRRNTPPCRQTRQDAAPVSAQGAARAGRSAEDPPESKEDGKEALSLCFGGGNASGPIERAACLTARGHKDDFEMETFAVQALSGAISHPLTCATAVTEDGNARGVPIVAMRGPCAVETLTGRPITHTLNAANNGKGCGEDGSGRGVPIISMSYRWNARDAVAFAQNSRGEVRLEGGDGNVVGALSGGGGKPGQGFPAIASATLRSRGTASTAEPGGEIVSALCASGGRADTARVLAPSFEAHLQCDLLSSTHGRTHAWWQQWRVRRLMPLECERLQGLQDNYTLVPYRGKPAADGPRYKAIGNSMAVPCVAWVGQRLIRALGRTAR